MPFERVPVEFAIGTGEEERPKSNIHASTMGIMVNLIFFYIFLKDVE